MRRAPRAQRFDVVGVPVSPNFSASAGMSVPGRSAASACTKSCQPLIRILSIRVRWSSSTARKQSKRSRRRRGSGRRGWEVAVERRDPRCARRVGDRGQRNIHPRAENRVRGVDDGRAVGTCVEISSLSPVKHLPIVKRKITLPTCIGGKSSI